MDLTDGGQHRVGGARRRPPQAADDPDLCVTIAGESQGVARATDLYIDGEVGTGGNLVSDAHIAALAIEHRCGIVSFDNGFARFDRVSWRPPPA